MSIGLSTKTFRFSTEMDKEMATAMKVKKNPFYKTIMCKSLPDCQYKENCVYAHSEAEVRPMNNPGNMMGMMSKIFFYF